MRGQGTERASAVDEYGGAGGLVTLEDLLEEIVGPILDEYDVEEKLFETVDEHTAIVDGRLSIEEGNELMNLDLPTGEVDTIGGFVSSLSGRGPPRGGGGIVPAAARGAVKKGGAHTARGATAASARV